MQHFIETMASNIKKSRRSKKVDDDNLKMLNSLNGNKDDFDRLMASMQSLKDNEFAVPVDMLNAYSAFNSEFCESHVQLCKDQREQRKELRKAKQPIANWPFLPEMMKNNKEPDDFKLLSADSLLPFLDSVKQTCSLLIEIFCKEQKDLFPDASQMAPLLRAVMVACKQLSHLGSVGEVQTRALLCVDSFCGVIQGYPLPSVPSVADGLGKTPVVHMMGHHFRDNEVSNIHYTDQLQDALHNSLGDLGGPQFLVMVAFFAFLPLRDMKDQADSNYIDCLVRWAGHSTHGHTFGIVVAACAVALEVRTFCCCCVVVH